jgi:tetratricopeptide (TPR) repeat protein
VEAIGRILDHATTWAAVALAVASTLLVTLPASIEAGSAMSRAAAPSMLYMWSAMVARLPLASLALLAAVFVPAAVIVSAHWEGTGSAGVVLQRDYMPALVCHLMAWTAAAVPLIALQWLPLMHVTFAWRELNAVVGGLALAYFLTLSVCSVRTVTGTSFGKAAGSAACAGMITVAAFWLYRNVGVGAYYFTSPWVLYYLYRQFGSEFRNVGGGLNSRQRLRHLLETSTVNPRDADAHYQLGLIYQQRRDYAKAKACFEKAIAIDRNEADPLYQLGCILRVEGARAQALEYLRSAAALDDKHSSSEVWREIGAAHLDMGQYREAADVLREYADRREFDPEGLYYYGVALSHLQESEKARAAFQQAIDAVRTAPKHRRRKIQRWAGLASKQMRQLAA